MSRVSRKEDQFYDMLKGLGSSIASAAEPYSRMVSEWPESVGLIPRIKEFEVKGDEQVAVILEELNTSFITPFDREDLSALALEMDNVIDGMENVAARYELYDVGQMIPEAGKMNELICAAAGEIVEMVEHLPNFKKDPSIKANLKRITDLEDEGDLVFRHAMARIFAEHDDPIHVLKWKSLLDLTEETLDSCKYVANIVQSVIMKNA